MQELGFSINETDPAIQFPYKIQGHYINNMAILYASNDVIWTKAMKYLLTDLKWVIAWAIKRASQRSTQRQDVMCLKGPGDPLLGRASHVAHS